jgi:hypothetical protein
MICLLAAGRFAARIKLRTIRCVLGLCAAASLCGVGVTASAATNEILWEAPGVCYYREVNPRLPLTVHVVRIDRAQKDLEFHTTLGGGGQIGNAVLSDQAKSIKPEFGQPVAAINGDYFYQYQPLFGDPMNLQILHGGELVSGPGLDRAFLYLDAQGEPHLTNAVDAFCVTWPDGKATPIGLNELPSDTRKSVLFTSAAGPTTRIGGLELVLERIGDQPWLPLRVGQTLSAKVREVNRQGFSKITADGLVLSLDPKQLDQFPPLVPGLELKISTATTPDLSGATLAIGGGPSLVREGKARESQGFRGQMREPRSAMGWNSQYYYFVQADGRQPRYSMGMSLAEMANYFVALKCDYAINLDGGGSCTTWIAGKIVNSPSQGGRERPSANALVLVRKPTAGK